MQLPCAIRVDFDVQLLSIFTQQISRGKRQRSVDIIFTLLGLSVYYLRKETIQLPSNFPFKLFFFVFIDRK